MPVAETELRYDTPWQLLVAVMLSAQCTDKRVNMVTPALFAAYPDARSMSLASFDDVFGYVRSVSYPRSKTEHLLLTARMVVSDFNGEVPQTIDALTSLPGVGRKTANVIMAVVWGKPAMAVDTHVFRVSHRLGLAPDTATTPLAVEQALTEGFRPDIIPKAHHWLILHGRYTCTARKPKCGDCFLSHLCKHFQA